MMIWLTLVSFAYFVQPIQGQTACPTSAFVQNGSKCYLLLSFQTSYQTASMSSCPYYDSTTLFSSTTAQGFTDLISSGVLGSGSKTVWIGMWFALNNNTFYYASGVVGQSTDYLTNSTGQWAVGQPNASAVNDSDKACVMMSSNETAYEFSLVSCSLSYTPLCVAPSGTYTSTSTTTTILNTPKGSTVTNEMDYILNSFIHNRAGDIKCSAFLATITVCLSLIIKWTTSY